MAKTTKNSLKIWLSIIIITGILAGFLIGFGFSKSGLGGFFILHGIGEKETTMNGSIELYTHDNTKVTAIDKSENLVYYALVSLDRLTVLDKDIAIENLPKSVIVKGKLSMYIDIPWKSINRDKKFGYKKFNIIFRQVDNREYVAVYNNFKSDYITGGGASGFPDYLRKYKLYVALEYDVMSGQEYLYKNQRITNPDTIYTIITKYRL